MITADEIREHLPKYLSPAKQEELVAHLRDFENRNYYTTLFQEEALQGDGWTKLEVINFETGARDKIKGILLSNSCDIDSRNPRDFPPRIVFAPIVALGRFVELLNRSALEPEKIAKKVISIRKQHISSLFYLPQGGALDMDYIAILDDLHNVPLKRFMDDGERGKLFTLSQMGFYLFLLKLSMHLCRFQEGIARDTAS
jgi:hypothetical protein